MTTSRDWGWMPHVAPMVAFLFLIEVSSRTPDSMAAILLAIRVIVPMAMIVFFYTKHCYPELQLRRSRIVTLDVLVGIGLAVLWVAPFVLFPSLRPDARNIPFDPEMAGRAMVPLVLTLRMLGYALVTPVMEELFMRSFLPRFVDAQESGEEFDALPVGRFTWKSFLVVQIVFLATHMNWEWCVMLPWSILSTLWLMYRKDLTAVIVLHAATNGSILLAAIFASDVLPDGDGGTLPLWFLI